MHQPRRKNAVRVLFAEDDHEARDVYSRYLENEGISVREACSGREAIAKAAEADVDVIVIELSLPDMDGFAVCREIRRQPNTGNVPVLALAAYPRPGIAAAVRAAGFDKLVLKTSPPDVLLAEILAVSVIRPW